MTSLTFIVLWHAALGIGLAAIVWAVGAGCLPSADLGIPRALTSAYPVGLLIVTGAAMLVLLDNRLVVVSAAALALPIGRLALARRHIARPSRASLVRLGVATGGALATATTLGLLLHGPSATRNSRAFGDMLFYVNKIVSATQSLVPFHDLLAEGQRIIYVEGSPSFVGAALEPLPGFDVVLFNVTTLPCFLVASLAAGALLLSGGRPVGGGLVVAGLVLASTAYVTFLTESPPMAFALPLTFSLYRLWADRLSTRAVAALVAVLGADFLLTKVVGALPLGLVLVGAVLGRHPAATASTRARAITAGALTAAAALAIAVLFATAHWYASLVRAEFFPLEALRGLRAQLDGLDTGRLAPAVTIVGELALAAAAARARPYALFTALAASIAASWFVRGIVFEGALGPALLLLALAAWEGRLPRDRLFTIGALAIGLSIWLREVYGVRTGLVLTVLALASLLPGFERRAVTLVLAGAAAVTATILGLAGLAFVGAAVAAAILASAFVRVQTRRLALGVGALVAGALVLAFARPLALSTLPPTLTRDDYDIWHRVRERVPEDGLVFTSMTGRRIELRQGWNNYPSIAGRQVYIAGWYDGRLTAHPAERDRRLRLNRAVLAGRRRPATLGLSRRFSSYFAVVRAGDRVPRSFELVHENRRFALYRIGS